MQGISASVRTTLEFLDNGHNMRFLLHPIDFCIVYLLFYCTFCCAPLSLRVGVAYLSAPKRNKVNKENVKLMDFNSWKKCTLKLKLKMEKM